MKTRIRIILFLTILLSLTQNGSLYSQDNDNKNDSEWNQWRGPNRDGISNETNILKSWPKDGPKINWRIPVGPGYSGVSVSKNKLFTMWDEGNSQYLICLNAQDGKELWRYRIGDNYVSGWGDGPLVTPTVNENIVYAISTSGHLHAVNIVNGKALWSQDLKDSYGFKLPIYGYAVSPLIVSDKLFIETGGKENYAFIALNKFTGELIWHSQTDLAAYSSPIAIKINDIEQIVFLSEKGLFSVSSDDGTLLWEFDWESRCPSSGMTLNSISPTFIAPDKVFISNAHGSISGGALVRITEQNNQFEVKKLWQSDQMKNDINASVFYNNHIYGFDLKTLKSIDASTGEVNWMVKGFGLGSLIVVDGHLIVLDERGKLALIEASPNSYNLIASTQVLDGRSWVSPTLADGKLYIRNHTEMVSIQITKE